MSRSDMAIPDCQDFLVELDFLFHHQLAAIYVDDGNETSGGPAIRLRLLLTTTLYFSLLPTTSRYSLTTASLH